MRRSSPAISALDVRLLATLLLLFALDAERRHRASAQAREADLLLALLADPEGTVVDPTKGELDLVE
jgi:hypothetical protein